MMSDTPAEAEQMAEPTKAPETQESTNESTKRTAEQAATIAKAPKSSARTVVLDGYFVIDPSKPFEELDTATAKAYAAEDRRDPNR